MNKDTKKSNQIASGVTANTIESHAHKVDATKRKILLGAAAGTATAIWHKPVIDSILLPVHAQTSGAAVFFSSAVTVLPIAKNSPVLDFLVESAHAGFAMASYEYAVSVAQSAPGVDQYSISLFERTLNGMSNTGEVLYNGAASLSGGGNLAVVDDPCGLSPSSLSVTIESVGASQVVLTLPSRSQQLVVPAGSGTVPSPVCVDTGLPASFYDPDVSVFPSSSKSSLFDSFIPAAHAGGPSPGATIAVLATKIDETRYTVGMLSIDRTTLREGIIDVGGSGQLVFVSTTCSESPAQKGSRPIAAEIVSVDESGMLLNLTLDGDVVPISLSVGEGMLIPQSCDPEGDFTNSGLGLGKREENAPQSFGERLIGAVIPEAHAGIAPSTALNTQTIVNASSNGNGTYDVVIGLSQSFIERDDISAEIGAVLSATLTLNSPSYTDVRTVVAGCNESINARISSNGPNSLMVELERIEVASATFFMNPGTTPIDLPMDCFYER